MAVRARGKRHYNRSSFRILLVVVYRVLIVSILIFGDSGVLAYSDRSVCLPSVSRIVYCGQTVQDRHIVCIEVE